MENFRAPPPPSLPLRAPILPGTTSDRSATPGPAVIRFLRGRYAGRSAEWHRPTMRFRFVHAADLHLDTPFTGIAEVDRPVAEALRDASLRAWSDLVELCVEEGASFLLLAGDTYDGPRRGLRAQMAFLQGLRRLDRAGIAVLAVSGNHDPEGSGWSAISGWPPTTTFFPADGVRSVPVLRDGRALATVYGISYARPDESRNLAALFPRLRGPGPDGVRIGLLHCNVGSDPDHGDYAPCTTADLRAAAVDYWALGHVHRHRLVLAGDPVWAAYPGVLQGRSPAPVEAGPKGALVVDCDTDVPGGLREAPRLVPLDRIRFAAATADVTAAADLAAAAAAVAQTLEDLRADPAHAGRGVVVRVILAGSPEAAWPSELPRLLRSGELLQQVRAAAAHLRPFVWCEGLRPALAPAVAREAVAGRGDFAAALVAATDALASDAGALDALVRTLKGELPRTIRDALADGGDRSAGPGDIPAAPGAPDDRLGLLAAAEQECLRLLADEGEGAP